MPWRLAGRFARPARRPAGRAVRRVFVQQVDVGGQPVFAPRGRFQQPLQKRQGAAGIAPFAVQLGQVKAGRRIVAVVPQGKLEFAERQRHQAGFFAQHGPLAMAAAFVAAGEDDGFHLGLDCGIRSCRESFPEGIDR